MDENNKNVETTSAVEESPVTLPSTQEPPKRLVARTNPNPVGHGQFKPLEPIKSVWKSKSKKKNLFNRTKQEIDFKRHLAQEKRKAQMQRPPLADMEIKSPGQE